MKLTWRNAICGTSSVCVDSR